MAAQQPIVRAEDMETLRAFQTELNHKAYQFYKRLWMLYPRRLDPGAIFEDIWNHEDDLFPGGELKTMLFTVLENVMDDVEQDDEEKKDGNRQTFEASRGLIANDNTLEDRREALYRRGRNHVTFIDGVTPGISLLIDGFLSLQDGGAITKEQLSRYKSMPAKNLAHILVKLEPNHRDEILALLPSGKKKNLLLRLMAERGLQEEKQEGFTSGASEYRNQQIDEFKKLKRKLAETQQDGLKLKNDLANARSQRKTLLLYIESEQKAMKDDFPDVPGSWREKKKKVYIDRLDEIERNIDKLILEEQANLLKQGKIKRLITNSPVFENLGTIRGTLQVSGDQQKGRGGLRTSLRRGGRGNIRTSLRG